MNPLLQKYEELYERKEPPKMPRIEDYEGEETIADGHLMKIEITYTPHPTKGYTATIWDGPDGIDEDSFVCRSLGECFEQIVMWRTLNALNYREDKE